MSVDYGEVVMKYGETPLRVRRDRRRAQLLEAAGAAFTVNGYHATRMDDIAVRARISKPVVYGFFSSKLELYLTVLQIHIDTLVADVSQGLRTAEGNEQRTRAAIQAYFDFVDDETQGYRLVFESDGISEPSVQLRVMRGVESCVGAVFDAISRDSGLSAYAAQTMAVGLVGASQFAAQYWWEAGRPVSKQEAVDAAVAMCWGGLSRAPRRPVG